ncbi:MAG: P27 family phage terminase small subunit [Firmicutes bacterium]|nr:P27 family phage terminase small subunit [Bacillota bacterium]
MSKASIIKSTTEKMQILGTYRPEFDDLIARYAEMVEKYSKFAKKVKGDDDISTESAAGTSKLSPMVRVVSDLRRDILIMEDKLLLTPREYYKVFPPTVEEKKNDRIKEILEQIKD